MPMENRRSEGCPDLVRGEVPVATDFAPVGALAAVVQACRLLIGKGPLLTATRYLAFASCRTCPVRILVGHERKVERGSDRASFFPAFLVMAALSNR